GSLPWAELVEPSIRLAAKGFALGWQEASSLNSAKNRFDRFPGSASFSRADGQEWAEGDTLKQPDLAATLERIARQGRDGFYKGETARLIVVEMRRGDGIITLSDLENYTSVWREPIRIRYKDYTLVTMPPPSSGGIALGQIL